MTQSIYLYKISKQIVDRVALVHRHPHPSSRVVLRCGRKTTTQACLRVAIEGNGVGDGCRACALQDTVAGGIIKEGIAGRLATGCRPGVE